MSQLGSGYRDTIPCALEEFCVDDEQAAHCILTRQPQPRPISITRQSHARRGTTVMILHGSQLEKARKKARAKEKLSPISHEPHESSSNAPAPIKI
ncbi:hypothetical protein PAAG_12567 [Paracoccidioides lutzii Pb01]|uniref:Uncharacterized protein n=1 Tax=Paracoccidioides lutzii (strain ATCC MYA-826 / Pb01) TaxID=502779 RepID=A0A0A2UYW5_PARBA|nr:hypothetical protein PAAG_12567 [Paracoccidioides lutzii Pb01]KGQ00756.1 hypothetical protein PAAG_12567 [Paracoccidioides lutzii Pb01]